MARFSASALTAALAVVSSAPSPSGGIFSVSAYIPPTQFHLPHDAQKRHPAAAKCQRRNSRNSVSPLAASRSGAGTSSTFRPLFDDDRLSPLDDTRRIPKTGSTGGALSVEQSSANRGARTTNANRRSSDVPNDLPNRRPNNAGAGRAPPRKKGPLWGMFPGNGNNGNDDQRGGSGRGDEEARMPERVRLSDLGKDTDQMPSERRDSADNTPQGSARSSGGSKKVWGGRYAATNSTDDLTDSSYFGPRGGPAAPYGPPPDEFLYDDVVDEYDDPRMYERDPRERGGRDDMMGGGMGGGGGDGGGVDAYGRPNRSAGRMNAPPMEAPPQQQMKNKGGPPSGGSGGRRQPNFFDKVSNFVADSGTIAVLKTEIGFLEREIKSRKQRFGVDAYDAIDQLEYEHETFLRRLEEEGRSNDQDAIDAELDRMEADKEFRLRRLYENARRDIVGFEREIGYKEEEIMDIEAAETEKQDAAWDQYRRPGGDGGAGGPAGGINVGRKDKYVRVPNDPNAVANKPPPQQQQQQGRDQDRYGRIPKTPPPLQQPPPPQPQAEAQRPKKSVRLSDIGKEDRNVGGGGNAGFDGQGDGYFSNPLEGRGTRPQERSPQPRGRTSDMGKQRQTIDEIFDNLGRRQGERQQQQQNEDFDRRYEDEFDDRMPPPPNFQQQQQREPIVPPPPSSQQEERQPIIPPPPRSSAPSSNQPMNAPPMNADVGGDAGWGNTGNGPQADPYGRSNDEFDRYGRKSAGGTGEWKRGDEWEPPRFEDDRDRKVY